MGRNISTSGYTGVTWSSKAQAWTAVIEYNGKRIYLGHFNNPEDGYKFREEARSHIESGDFEEWLKAKRAKRLKKNKDRRCKPEPSPGYPGVCRNVRNGKWNVYINFNGKRTYVGVCNTAEEGSALRKEAEEHINIGDFASWKESRMIRRERQRNTINSGTPGVCWNAKNNNWSVWMGYNNNQNYIASYNSLDDARAARKEAEEHVILGDFEEWLQKIKDENLKKRWQ